MGQSMTHTNNEDDHTDRYLILWLDESVNTQQNILVQQKLYGITKLLETFVDATEFLHRIRYLKDDNITVIVSDQMGRIIIPKIQDLTLIKSIYVYSHKGSSDKDWIKPYSKVKDVYTTLDELINGILLDRKKHKELEEPLSINVAQRSSTNLSGGFVHSQLLIYVLLKMKSNDTNQQALIQFVKKQYEGKTDELKIVDEFAREYNESKAIWWYTRESFVYHLLNKALRIGNLDVLYLFHTVIQDIFKQLRAYQCKERIRVYRGQYVTQEEFSVLRTSVGKYISMNAFLSTSTNHRVARSFLDTGSSGQNKVAVLMEIDADPRVVATSAENMRPFSKIAELSAIPSEDEVLFMLGSIFLVENMCEDGKNGNTVIWKMVMRLCGEEENAVKEVYDSMEKEYEGGETNVLDLGTVAVEMGKLDLAEKYCLQFLSEAPSTSQNICHAYNRLGVITSNRGEYAKSLNWYEKSLDVYKRRNPPDYLNMAVTYSNIGEVYRKRSDFDQALNCYNRAVSILKETQNENHEYMASFYTNIGLIYEIQEEYRKALEFFQQSLAIKRKHFPEDHYRFGITYGNIGNVCLDLEEYDLALQHFNRSLSILEKSLPPEHPSIAGTYGSMGIVYEKKNDLNQALTLTKKACTLFEMTLPPKHPNVIKTKQQVRKIEDQLRRR